MFLSINTMKMPTAFAAIQSAKIARFLKNFQLNSVIIS